MTDTLLLTSTMSNDRQRIRQIKYHINQLLSELRIIESNNNHIQPLNISINSQLTTILHEENFCPYLSCKQKAAILHSTTNNQCRKKSKKFLFAASARATSTPKTSPNHYRIILKPHHTSTPRRSKRHSTPLALSPNNIIPLKRLLYNKDYAQHKRRHSAVPFSKRSILPRLHPIDENQQWI
ncbi:unnamed protein product [Rotaria sp. Silwood2]|nr:unnamed protein product [Rotaria sp. Silwood2]CAF2780164.1 unnamed protein product [Rotaria sp. Silwood2]CAF3172475.1 unnamed protein product [Rotaria sp. Silwood2]CAF4328574.1 unnamed protein product [Rotaria sp. Silwood2]CAF4530144.1 unnamed protein product [Rotaria sp. Silwood2]